MRAEIAFFVIHCHLSPHLNNCLDVFGNVEVEPEIEKS